MKLISWNVNGLRACIQKGFLEEFSRLNADFFCLQETKLQPGQVTLDLPGYEQYWNYAEKKGYSGTAIFTKYTPMSVRNGIGIPEFDTEGRVITLEYPEFYLVTCYTPNAQRGLARLDYRMDWDEAFRGYLQALDAQKPVILCGDLNVAHQEIDLKNPKSNRGSAGFSDEERESFTKTLSLGFTDTYRHLNPDATGVYSWWSYMYHARENNAGWRIDYFVVSDRIRDAVYKTPIYTDIMGSDHCPVGLEIDLLCNGSLWSPTAMGKATDKTPPKPPISPALKSTLICLLCLLLLTGGFFTGRSLFSESSALGESPTESSGPLIDPEPVYFSSHLYDELLNHVYSKGHGRYFTSDDGERYRLSQGQYNSFLNFWLRLDYIDTPPEYYVMSTPVYPKVEVISGTVSDLSCHAFINEADDSHYGWFVTGYINDPAVLKITYGSQSEEITVTPLRFILNRDPANSLYTVSSYNSLDGITYFDSDRPNEWSMVTLDNRLYMLGEPVSGGTPSQTPNFLIQLELTDAGRQYYKATQELPVIINQSGGTTQWICQPYQNMLTSTVRVEGWLIYGWCETPTTFVVSYGSDGYSLPVSPSTSQELAVSVYLVENPVFLTDNSILTLDNQLYILGNDILSADRENANCWILLELTDEGRKNYTAEFYPEVSYLIPPGSNASVKYGVCPYYHVVDGQPGGWMIYLSANLNEQFFIRYDREYTVDLFDYRAR